MKVIVITGSTRGIGFHLAQALLERDCQVVVSGRQQPNVEEAVAALAAQHPSANLLGFAGDVTRYEQHAALWQAAVQRFGRVDVWVNNAGIASTLMPYWQVNPQEIADVTTTNIIGMMYGTRLALEKMRQQGAGAIYNMEGYGSKGRRMVDGLAVYGASKAGLNFFNQVVAREAARTPVIIGSFNPGMVATDMLLKQYEGKPKEWEAVRPIFNIIAERPETVAPWMAECILTNTQNGRNFSYNSTLKLSLRFLTAPFKKRDIFSP